MSEENEQISIGEVLAPYFTLIKIEDDRYQSGMVVAIHEQNCEEGVLFEDSLILAIGARENFEHAEMQFGHKEDMNFYPVNIRHHISLGEDRNFVLLSINDIEKNFLGLKHFKWFENEGKIAVFRLHSNTEISKPYVITGDWRPDGFLICTIPKEILDPYYPSDGGSEELAKREDLFKEELMSAFVFCDLGKFVGIVKEVKAIGDAGLRLKVAYPKFPIKDALESANNPDKNR